MLKIQVRVHLKYEGTYAKLELELGRSPQILGWELNVCLYNVSIFLVTFTIVQLHINLVPTHSAPFHYHVP